MIETDFLKKEQTVHFSPMNNTFVLLHYSSIFKALLCAINAIENPMNAMISHTHRKKILTNSNILTKIVLFFMDIFHKISMYFL